MTHAQSDLLWQVIGMTAAIGPVLVLAVWLGIASRRRQAAERAEIAPEL